MTEPENSTVRRSKVRPQSNVTELRDALHQQEILLDEVNHRVKNTMAQVQALALLTRGASTVDEYVDGFQQRLLSLSRAYNLLTDNGWQGVELRDVVEGTLAAYSKIDQRVLDGPSLFLKPNVTLALAAALQELSTNAAKYGALSVRDGRVTVRWSVSEGRLHLYWIESNGPEVRAPSRRGFGSKLIENVLAKETGWTAKISYPIEGMNCHLVLRVD